MKTRKEKFCYLTPPFPKSAFMIMLSISKKSNPYKTILFYPSKEIFPAINDALENVVYDKKAFIKVDDLYFQDVALLIPLTFESLYPLRREFWDDEIHDFTFTDRVAAFIKASVSPDLNQVLVTPGLFGKKWRFSAAVPFLPTADNKTLEQFMLHSNWPVDERAKYAGIYKMEKSVYINLKTRQIKPINLLPVENSKVN